MIREIVLYGDPVLREKGGRVEEVSQENLDRVRRLLERIGQPALPESARRETLLTLVETGPELVNLPRGSRINSVRETADMIGGVTVNINNPTVANEP